MYIKRGAFLLLTSVIAQQACTIKNTDGDNATGGNGNTGNGGSSGGGGTSATGGASATGGSAGSGTGGSSAGAGGDAGGSFAEGGASAGQGAGGAAGGASAGEGGASAGEGGASGGAGGSGSGICDDSVGTPGNCSAISTTACSWEHGYCLAAGVNLKPKVAETAVACMLASPNCTADFYGCVRSALGNACPDASADAFCATAVATCNPAEALDLAGCHALVDGLSATGLESVHSCVESGCDFGLWSCVEGLQ